MKVAFAGTPEFAAAALEAILAAGFDVPLVLTQPDRPAGRGMQLQPSPVKRVALAAGIPVHQPEKLRTPEQQAPLAAVQADVLVVAAYGIILPQAVLDIPRFGCLNIHASLLPRWRGAAPIQRAIMAGDAETGVAIMQMEAGLDTGPVLAEARTPIGLDETTADLHDRLAGMGAALIVDVLGRLPMVAVPQAEDGVIYASKIDKAEARIDWSRPAVEVDRLIRGLSPFPGAWCEIGDERVKLLRSRVIAGAGAPGEVLGGFQVACGSGAIEVLQAQRAGKRPMEASEILRGMVLPAKLG